VSSVDFSAVTEVPGNLVRPEALDMLRTRYEFAARLSEGRDVLEVACGPGPGLGLVASQARHVVGGDYTEQLVRLARQAYSGRIPVVQMDAQHLPFEAGSFDVVLVCEALYYLPDQAQFVAEAHRVLRPAGRLIVVSVNPLWRDFNPSPFSTGYHDAESTRRLLENGRFTTVISGAFRTTAPTVRDRAVSMVRRTAVRLGLIPKTMGGKETLKRLFYGELAVFPSELRDTMGVFHAPEPLSDESASENFKVLYAVGTRS
jgi:SAM-dependent methyltransferase